MFEVMKDNTYVTGTLMRPVLTKTLWATASRAVFLSYAFAEPGGRANTNNFADKVVQIDNPEDFYFP
jgi:hypothetical protein